VKTGYSILSGTVLDIREAFNKYHLFISLGWQDVATRYRRSRVGAFWLTINMSILIAVLGFVFGSLFAVPLDEFLPYLAIGLILWGFISTSIIEGCTSFVDVKDMVLQVNVPFSIHLFRIVWRNVIILAHNLLIIPIIFLIFEKPLTMDILFLLPGFIILLVNLLWMMMILSVFCTRFRDMVQIIQNFMQVMFYLTPIIWSIDMLPERANIALLELNPFYHLITLLRSPLLGELPAAFSIYFSLIFALIGWIVALVVFGRYHRKLPYWL